ncbi:hypothetical protein C8R42DRAFT_680874 [Lentinula raphanica]|nr:hypothetical protein C8R42DRAFT_680874 [Lentinula raphanica]
MMLIICDDEDYGFDYSDGDDAEEYGNADVENMYYTAKCELNDALQTYTQLLSYTKSAAITRNYSEKTINGILDYVGAGKGGPVEVDCPEEILSSDEISLRGSQERPPECSDQGLSNLKLAKLWLDWKSLWHDSIYFIRDLHLATKSLGDGDDQSQRGTQLLEIYALEIQMYNETRNFKKLKEIYNASNTVWSAIPHPRIMGVIKECGGKMWMGERQWKRLASEDFFEAFRNYDEAGSPQRIQVLEVNPFDSQETLKPYKNEPEFKAMTDLVDAYQRREVHSAEKILRGKLCFRYLFNQLNVEVQEVEELLIGLILEGKVEGRIDQVGMRAELDRKQSLEKKRCTALQKWTENLETVHGAVVGNTGSTGRLGDPGMTISDVYMRDSDRR